MAIIHREFESRDEAEGFVRGLEYVNDPAYQVEDTIKITSNCYIVVFTDRTKKIDELSFYLDGEG